MFKIGILDFGLSPNEVAGAIDYLHTVDYVIECEKLGFTRFWLAEHHVLSTQYSWSSPEILLPILAGHTDKIKIGIGGVLLNIHSVYRVACTFKMLSNLFPNRIELGIAKGIPDNIKIVSDFGSNNSENFYDKFQRLNFMLKNESDFLKENAIVIPPYKGEIPNVWGLGSSKESLRFYSQNKVNFVLSTFHGAINIDEIKSVLNLYPENNIIVAISGTIGETTQIAKNRKQLDDPFGIVGDLDTFKNLLDFYKKEIGATEFIFFDTALNYNDKFDSLRLLKKLLS